MKDKVIAYIKEYLLLFIDQSYKIELEIVNENYVLNNTIETKIYEFWNKTKEELLEDFVDYSFKGDYIGTIFFFLSGYWEFINDQQKDNYGRFPGKDSFPYLKGVLEEPVVDILVNRIVEELNLKFKDNELKPKIFLTHDIDHLSMIKGLGFYTSIAADIIKKKDIKTAIKKVRMKIKNIDPHSVERLVIIHKKYNTKGTYFFLPGFQKKSDRVGIGYDPKANRKLINLYLDLIDSTSGNVGIHYDSGHLVFGVMEKCILKLQDVLNRKIQYGRAHYLIFDIKKSFEIYEKNNFKIDTTGSYADKIGFRFGTSRPFKPFNFNSGSAYSFFEVPLIIMEGSLQGRKHMNLTPEEGLIKIREIMDKIEKYNGVFTFLWHNTSFFTKQWSDWESVYEETIKYGIKKGFVSVNAEDIINLYEVNNE
ncbi:MAG: DUF7033 domain-containing protein [Eubacteriales bacterium]